MTVSSDRVYLPEPFLRYRCNLGGCCCGGWGVRWLPEDIARVARFLPREEMEELTRDHLELILDEDGRSVMGARLKISQPGQRCPMLGPEGRCGLQERFGIEALPGICIDFPVVPYRLGERVELSYRLTCPGVIDCLFVDHQEPPRWVEMGEPGEMFRARLARVGPEPELSLGKERLAASNILLLRDRILAHLEQPARPTMELLAEIEWGLSRVRTIEELQGFAPVAIKDPMPFVRYLTHCLSTHASKYLLDNLDRFRRFVFDPELAWLLDPPPETLESWQEGLQRWVEPAEPLLRPYLQRYLWVRYASCFVHLQGEVCYSFGEVTHELAITLRYLSAFCAAAGRKAEPRMLKLALGAASHLFHTHGLPVQSQVWFRPESFMDDRPPRPQVPGDLEARVVPCQGTGRGG